MLPKGPYNSNQEEPEILKYWLEHKFFKPEYDREKGLLSTEAMKNDKREPFCIVNPPPNAYMRPHIGNVSGYAYQDVFLRYNRMLGKKVLGQPGKDHAGIQGEVTVEKIFIKEKGKDKQAMGREEFYRESYAHFEKLMPMIMADEQRIGLSSDYERNLFTLDPKIVTTVLGTFVKLYQDGMIYKGVRIVNWDPVAKTTLADIDTERVERNTELVYINYPLKEPEGEIEYITVATTRAETMLGDTAVIVNPKDKRYKKFIGKKVILPLANREMPIITSPRVEMAFGTGAVKLTPAHAYDDYVMMNEWNAEHPELLIGYINVVDRDARMCGPISEKYLGLTTEQARTEVTKDLEALDLIAKKEPYRQSVVLGERSKAVIEPIMDSQWFVDVEKLKKPAIDIVKQGKIQIHPTYMTKKYLQWMENLHDWPVSRSLWWGYRIPVWYKGGSKQYIDKNGQIREEIGGKEINSPQDYQDLMYVGLNPPGINLTVIRHGNTDFNKEHRVSGQTPEPLNEEGKKQSLRFARELKKQGVHYDAVITSPLPRSLQSAEIIAQQLNLKLEANDLLRERNFGELDGLTWDEFEQKYPELAKQNSKEYQENLPGGESIPEVEARVDAFIEQLKQEYRGKKALVVTHAGIIRILKRKLGNVSLEQSRSQDITNLEPIELNIPDPEWIQDDDVLDTWFSSGQWPYATLSAQGLMDTFYPTDIMETAYDILELWVSRMIMLGLYTQQEIPFKHVYLHGLVKAPDGQKMSKSKGNVIGPEEIINKYGADALRLMYIVGNKAGAGYPVSYEKLEGYKRFLNKIWNASKFVLGFSSDLDVKELEGLSVKDLRKISANKKDQALLKQLQQLAKKVTKNMESYRIGMASEMLYQEFWHNFCDIYLEEVKPRVYTKDRKGKEINNSGAALAERRNAQRTLMFALKTYLTLLHPFVPFITERVWQELAKTSNESSTIMYANWLV